MKNMPFMDFSVDRENRSIKVDREFHAPLKTVWAAWTQSDILDQWWAPKPWKAVTVSMDFSEGSRWHYYMQGPDGERHYCLADYKSIDESRQFTALDAFCDENAEINPEMPRSLWTNSFEPNGESTVVHIKINYDRLEDLDKIIEMGFKEGFTMGLQNLDAYLAGHSS